MFLIRRCVTVSCCHDDSPHPPDKDGNIKMLVSDDQEGGVDKNEDEEKKKEPALDNDTNTSGEELVAMETNELTSSENDSIKESVTEKKEVEEVEETKEEEQKKEEIKENKEQKPEHTISKEDHTSSQDDHTHSPNSTPSPNNTESFESDDNIVTFEEFKSRANQEINQPLKQPQGNHTQ